MLTLVLPMSLVATNGVELARTPNASLALRQGSMTDACQTLVRVADGFGLTTEADRVRDRIRDMDLGLMVLIAGEGNFGKSSLINALAGRPIAPVSILPKTTKVDVYRCAPGEEEWAELRFKGEPETFRTSIAQAEALCQAEEKRLMEAAKAGVAERSRIVESVWYRTGLAIDSAICLVDTPGLAQFSVSDGEADLALVKGLGATYSVDEIWALWYHRADVVLWAFQSNGLESKETFRSIEQVTQLFHKPVVPIATKADLVPEHQRERVIQVFDETYRPLLGEQCLCPPVFTVTGGRSPDLGLGIPELRDRLLALVPIAAEQKLQSSELFVRDLAAHLEHLLGTSATQLVDNLRLVADAGDEAALFAMARGREVVASARQRAHEHVAAKLAYLDDVIDPLFERLKTLAANGKNENDLRMMAEEEIRRYLELGELDEFLNANLDHLGLSVAAQADSICASKELRRVRISASGSEMRTSFSMRVRVQLAQTRLRFTFPAFDFRDLSYNLGDLLMDALGWAARGAANVAGSIIKAIFG